MSTIIRSSKPTAQTSKTDGYTLTLRDASSGEELRVQGVFINVVRDQSTLKTEDITMEQFIKALRNPEIEVEAQLIQPREEGKKSGFFS